jgi:hypothetical protein
LTVLRIATFIEDMFLGVCKAYRKGRNKNILSIFLFSLKSFFFGIVIVQDMIEFSQILLSISIKTDWVGAGVGLG